jgi:prepilin-type N-terminal cleavage/methylation domain-containing protein/prepilin-type processing-associated H-X9-DG protein
MQSGSSLRAPCCAVKYRHVAAGMTLVELLVVIAIIGTLLVLLLPAVQAARESARRAQCQSNLRQLGVAMALHANAKGSFPVGCLGYRGDFSVEPPVRARFIAWNVHLLPFLDEHALWESFNFSIPSYDPLNKAVGAALVDVFLCPSTLADPQLDIVDDPLRQTRGLWKGTAFTDYAGIYGVEGPTRARDDIGTNQTIHDNSLGVLIYDEPVAPREVADGLSKTACIAESVVRRETECEWVNGQNIFANDEATPLNRRREAGNEIGSPHPGGASLVFCDAHVAFVADSVEQEVLNGMLTKAGGE